MARMLYFDLHFFNMHLITREIGYISMNCLFLSFAPFSNWLVIFSLTICKSSYVSGKLPFSSFSSIFVICAADFFLSLPFFFFTSWYFKISFWSFHFYIVNQYFPSWLPEIKICIRLILYNLFTHYRGWSSQQPLKGGRVDFLFFFFFFTISSVLQWMQTRLRKVVGLAQAEQILPLLTSLTCLPPTK